MVQNDTAIAAIGTAKATIMMWKKSVRRACRSSWRHPMGVDRRFGDSDNKRRYDLVERPGCPKAFMT